MSENPQAEARLHEELDGVLGGRPPEAADFARLPYLQAVLSEILRLYPPAYIMAREVIEMCEIGDMNFFRERQSFFRSGWLIVILATSTIRMRFVPSNGLMVLRIVYLQGLMSVWRWAAACIGQGFAQLEAAIVIGTLSQRFRFRLVPGHPVEVEPLVTLRPRHGIRMTLHARK